MATYKLMQDIEAEDHILGPLSLRQFIFALISAFLSYFCFFCVTKGLAFLLVILAPPTLFCIFFAIPFGRDQPTEIWALAKLRFWFRPRSRTWDQSGVKELVTINAPKKVERVLTNGLTEAQVESRLKALSSTIDTRGWAIKHVNSKVNDALAMDFYDSDRLIDASSMPQEVPSDFAQSVDDIMDETSSPIARQFDNLINESSQTRHQQLLDQAGDNGSIAADDAYGQPAAAPPGAVPSADNDSTWFMGQDGPAAAVPPVKAANVPDETGLAARLKANASSQRVSYGNLRTLRPLEPKPTPVAPAPAQETQAVTAQGDPAIISLANNNDFNVATLAREAQKAKEGDQPDEVVVSFH